MPSALRSYVPFSLVRVGHRWAVRRGMVVRVGILLLTAMAAACGGNTSPVSPSGQAESFTWTVNGQSFTASSNGRGALSASSVLSITGADCGAGPVLSIIVPSLAVGTYTVGPRAASVSWTPDARASSAANEAWDAPGLLNASGSGFVTITSISADWVSGTFTAEVVPRPSNRDTSGKSVQGRFEMPIRDRRIC